MLKLASNTFVYMSGAVDPIKSLDHIVKDGFLYVDWAGFTQGDINLWSPDYKSDFIKKFHDLGLQSSQVLMSETRTLAASDKTVRDKTMDRMKRFADFQAELGGRQLLVCGGCGVLEHGISFEESWLRSRDGLRDFCDFCSSMGLLVGMEQDPHVYFICNSMERLSCMIEQVQRPNLYPNVDIGHMYITREAPHTLDKLKERIYHVHISETDSFTHTNSIIGTGIADFVPYICKVEELGIEDNCLRMGIEAAASIELGEPGVHIDDPDYWMAESLAYIRKKLPELQFC